MLGGVHRLAHEGNLGGDAGRGFVVHHAHRLDRMLGVLLQTRLHLVSRHAAPPVGGDELDLQFQLVGHLAPQGGEVAGLDHDDPVAGRERVDERGFPGARARGGVDHHRLLGLEDLADVAQHLQAELLELRAAMVDGRLVDRAQHAVGDVGRTGNLQEMATGGVAVQLEHGISGVHSGTAAASGSSCRKCAACCRRASGFSILYAIFTCPARTVNLRSYRICTALCIGPDFYAARSSR
jgi:hypothetical protein